MHGTNISTVPRVVNHESHNTRLSWLLAANASEERRRCMFRSHRDEEQMMLMKHAIAAKKTYALFGLMLGAIPPAVIFERLFGYGLGPGLMDLFEPGGSLFFLCTLMNAMCSLAGYAMGANIGVKVLDAERRSWPRMLLMLTVLGSVWGAVAGLVGGYYFFGVGGFFGVIAGIPIGLVGFVLFAVIHRMLERGGMIEVRHFLPLACGITTLIAAFIAGV